MEKFIVEMFPDFLISYKNLEILQIFEFVLTKQSCLHLKVTYDKAKELIPVSFGFSKGEKLVQTLKILVKLLPHVINENAFMRTWETYPLGNISFHGLKSF